jgi:hypothetical protein
MENLRTMKELEKFIGESVVYHERSQSIYGVNKDGNHQLLADIRGWGAIQNLFKDNKGVIDMPKAAAFQDEVGHWIADAIEAKLILMRDGVGRVG